MSSNYETLWAVVWLWCKVYLEVLRPFFYALFSFFLILSINIYMMHSVLIFDALVESVSERQMYQPTEK